MPRFRFRLATLGLLIVIAAMAVALVIQQRRERRWPSAFKSLRQKLPVIRGFWTAFRSSGYGNGMSFSRRSPV